MGIHSCTTCGTKFKYTTLWKILFLGREGHYRNLTCGNCGTAYEIVETSKVLSVILLALPWPLTMLFQNNKPTEPVLLSVYIFYMILLLIFLPYIEKYKIVEIDKKQDD